MVRQLIDPERIGADRGSSFDRAGEQTRPVSRAAIVPFAMVKIAVGVLTADQVGFSEPDANYPRNPDRFRWKLPPGYELADSTTKAA